MQSRILKLLDLYEELSKAQTSQELYDLFVTIVNHPALDLVVKATPTPIDNVALAVLRTIFKPKT